MKSRRGFLFGSAAASAAFTAPRWSVPASARQALAQQAWPTRPVKFLLTLGPGSGADTRARVFADPLGQRWGRAVVVEKRPGRDGICAIPALITAADHHQLP